jgi:hypothetical protein
MQIKKLQSLSALDINVTRKKIEQPLDIGLVMFQDIVKN